jgi:serine protease AprX
MDLCLSSGGLMGKLSSKAVWGAAIALWVMIPTASASASGGSGKLDTLLQEAGPAPQSVIVRYRADAKKSDIKNRIERRRGRVISEHRLIPAMTAILPAAAIADLANDSDVLSVSADADVTASAARRKSTPTSTTFSYSNSSSTADYNTVSTLRQALGLQDGFTGSSLTVAVIDSGIQSSSDFSGRIVGMYDFTSGRNGAAVTPNDEYGHGTHVAGLIGSSGAASNGKFAGVAPGVKLLALRVLDRKGAGKTSAVIAALEFAVANKDRFAIRIVNLSLGHPIYESAATDPLVQAVEATVRAGLVVVTAAGNYGTNQVTGETGYAGIVSPGNAPSAITVGASNTFGTDRRVDDRVADFSSRGPSWYDGIAKPDVVAPGTGLVSNAAFDSTLVTSHPSLLVTSGYSTFLRLDGSSMATAVVSGLTAVMLEANNVAASQRWQEYQSTLPKGRRTDYTGTTPLTANAVKAMLQYSATRLRNENGAPYDELTQGSGEVNGVGATTLAYHADTTKATGTYWLTASVPESTTFGGVEEPWSQSVIWGTRLVTGTSLVELNQVAWSDNIVWGTGEMDNIVWGTVSGDNIVWGTMLDGDNIVWGTSLFIGNAAFGDNIVWGTAMNWDDNIVWGTGLVGMFTGDNIVWGTVSDDADNIVWGTLSDDNIVWGTMLDGDNIVWGTSLNTVLIVGTTIIGGGL